MNLPSVLTPNKETNKQIQDRMPEPCLQLYLTLKHKHSRFLCKYRDMINKIK